MSDVVLWDFWRSSASYRVRIALNLAGIDYQANPIDLTKKAHKTPEHLARNPQGFVPVLDIDGLRLTQSLAILDYLDITRQMNLLPKDPGARAQAQALAHAIAIDIHPVCNLAVAMEAVKLAGREEARAEWMVRFGRPGMQAFETMLSAFPEAPYCCGDTPGFADLCLMPQIYNARRWGAQIDDLPRTMAVIKTCESNPAFIAAYPDAVKPE
jgi:maleylacetoacetate isomerase